MGSTDYGAAFASLSFVHYTSLVKQLLLKLFKLALMPKTKMDSLFVQPMAKFLFPNDFQTLLD